MSSKPAHWTAENAARFQDQSVVEHYPLRLPYPAELFDVLVRLITDEPRVVLDVGAGTGDLARHLVTRVARVDAVDWSAAMIAKGKTLPQGDHPQLRWIQGRIEQVEVQPPYALIVAGESLHWMDWEVVLPLFRRISTPNGLLAIARRVTERVPWQEELEQLIRRYSTMQNYQPFDLIAELERRGLFEKVGEQKTAPMTVQCTVEEYIGSFHSMSSLSLKHMSSADAEAFDEGVRALTQAWSTNGYVQLACVGQVVWGKAQG